MMHSEPLDGGSECQERTHCMCLLPHRRIRMCEILLAYAIPM